MKNVFKKIDGVKTGIFAAGVLFGTAGIKILSSQDAKKVYTNCTAAVLRAKKCVMKTATTIQENAGDIYAEAKAINDEREAAEEVVDDTQDLIDTLGALGYKNAEIKKVISQIDKSNSLEEQVKEALKLLLK